MNLLIRSQMLYPIELRVPQGARIYKPTTVRARDYFAVPVCRFPVAGGTGAVPRKSTFALNSGVR